MIYPVDSAIQRLNNWGQNRISHEFKMAWKWKRQFECREKQRGPKWRAWDEYVDERFLAPRWQSADKAMSVILSQRFMAVLCSRRRKWWKLTWALATPNLSPYLATGGGIIFALFPQGKTNFLVRHSSIDFMSFVHLLSTNRVMSIYETSVVRFCVLVALVHSNVKHG